MNEFELLAKIIPTLPTNDRVLRGAGDDCAVLDLGAPDKLILFKTDAVVEDVHFTASTPAAKVGRKALGRALSDIAAMAGEPTFCLVTIGLPKSYDPAFVEELYCGLNAMAREYSVALVGGETTRAEKIFVSISLLGTTPRSRVITRSGGKAGDAIFVTGELGGSISGKHLDFVPRLTEARWLADRFAIHSMIDLSDGLAGDIRHILAGSKLGAELLSAAIPISRPAKLKAKAEPSAKPPLLAALTDGEDFELLFTITSKDAVPLLDAWKVRFPEVKLSCIGKLTAQAGLHLRDKQGVRKLAVHGYTHFQKS